MKYSHHPETKIVLEDIKNRLTQFIEVSERTGHEEQKIAFQSARVIVQQAIDTGHVFRGSSFVPDPVEPLANTPSVTDRLGVE